MTNTNSHEQHPLFVFAVFKDGKQVRKLHVPAATAAIAAVKVSRQIADDLLVWNYSAVNPTRKSFNQAFWDRVYVDIDGSASGDLAQPFEVIREVGDRLSTPNQETLGRVEASEGCREPVLVQHS